VSALVSEINVKKTSQFITQCKSCVKSRL